MIPSWDLKAQRCWQHSAPQTRHGHVGLIFASLQRRQTFAFGRIAPDGNVSDIYSTFLPRRRQAASRMEVLSLAVASPFMKRLQAATRPRSLLVRADCLSSTASPWCNFMRGDI